VKKDLIEKNETFPKVLVDLYNYFFPKTRNVENINYV